MRRNLLWIALAAAFLCNSTSQAAPTSNVQAYPLTTCIMSGEELEGGGVVTEYQGREVRLCCKKCLKGFKKEPAKYIEKLDKAIIEDQMDIYPVSKCVISNEAFTEEMGEPVNKLVGNRLVRLCCKSCNQKLKAHPAAFIAKLDAAVVKAQSANYPATTCPISGEELGGMGEPHEMVVAGRLVRLCCDSCVEKVNSDPAATLVKIYGDDMKPQLAHSQSKQGHKKGHGAHDGHNH